MEATQIILGLVGLFSVAGGLFGWEWFLNHRKARLFVRLLGESGARGFYVVLGLGLVAFAFFGDFSHAAG